MYIWVGIDVDSQLSEIREKVHSAEEIIDFVHSNLTLPFHISLKISFFVPEEKVDAVMADILTIYKKTEPFSVEVRQIDWEETIVWISMKRNKQLDALHDVLNEMLLEKYSVPLHPYDIDYQFHTTLFMDDDREKNGKGYEMVKDIPLPDKLQANRFVIGISQSGSLGSFSIVQEVVK
ncbi:MAG: 2'-5' RNA ligase family protein [Ruminococcaceae bacterium]|nr:2'-5' RNA ligase family protein [Oscillospiraceae bacterium]